MVKAAGDKCTVKVNSKVLQLSFVEDKVKATIENGVSFICLLSMLYSNRNNLSAFLLVM